MKGMGYARTSMARRPIAVSKRGYKPTTRNGAMRKRHGKSSIGNRALGSRDILRNSPHLESRQRAQRQTGERYFARGAEKAGTAVPKAARNLGITGAVAYPRHDEAAQRWTRDRLDAATKEELREIASIAGVDVAKRWGKGKMVDTLDAHFEAIRAAK